ncbi:hypothetical protein Tco_0273723 [Tanacetum coccineum]
MFVFFVNTPLQNTMAEQNVPNQPPTRTDEQIISVDILSNTNFFQAFTASANVPAIYLQQFWNTMKYNEKTGVYSCQVDEQWFDLSADLLRKALAITPVIPAQPFELPPSGNTVIDFVNELGYPEPVEIVSNIRVNYVYQPWRAILTLINQCLTGKTSGSDKPRHPVLQMLWGIITQTNVDHAELLWEEFTQGIQTFFSHKASHKASLKDPKKKVTPLLIPYGRFSKVIIYYLASNNNIHRRPDSAVHHTGDDFILGNLKFVPKGETVEVFGMAIPDPLITEAIQQSSYYPKYLEMVAMNTKKTPQESASEQPATKRTPPKKPTTTTPVKPSKPAPTPTKKPSKHKLPQKVRKGKPTFQLVDEDDEAQQESVPQEEAPHDLTTGPSSQPEEDTSEKVIHESSSTSDSERTESETEASMHTYLLHKDQAGIRHEKANEALAGPDPKPMQEDQTRSDSGKVHVSLVGPNPEHMDDEFLATAYPKVHENLKLITEKTVHQAITSTPPVIAPITDFLSPKPSSLVTPPPINTEATTITTSLPEITPFIALQLRVARLEQEMSEVKKTDHSADLLIADEVPWIRKVAVKVKDIQRSMIVTMMRRDDDEGPSAGSKRVGQAKRRRPDSAAFWANTYATTYQVPEENKLQRKSYDIGSFIKWFCRQTGKKKLCKADLEGDKERKIALSISKLKAARYLDFGLEELVPSLWVESERDYDISAAYGITPSVQSMTSLTSGLGGRNSISTNTDATDYYFKEDYTIVPKPRAVIYRDRNDQRKLMWLNEIHKFSDGTLTRVMEKLDHMVKDFHMFEYNKGMEMRKWSEDDKRRSKDCYPAILIHYTTIIIPRC